MVNCISANSTTSTATCVGLPRSSRGGKVFPSVPPCPCPSCESRWAGMGRAYTPRPRRRLPHDITYETCRGVCQQFPSWNSAPTGRRPHSLSLTPYPLSFHILAHSFALSCIPRKLNPFVFNRFRTLCQKPPGVGVPESVWQLCWLG